ncbi:MAG: flagellar basal body protein FliL [Deltaproteobacteria bacterium]|nr:MAG: flagellar basal body protein FliL [Deltaproteobacteria bacterium]
MAEEKKKEKKEGKSKLILILVLMQAITLIAVVGLGAFMFLNFKKIQVPAIASVANANAEAQKQEEEKKEKKEKEVVKVKDEVICELEPFIVNLMDENGRRYLRVKMNLELSSKEAEDEVKKKMPEIRDTILMTLSGKKFADIANLEGKMRLRDEIKENVDKILLSGKVLQVYFTEFIIQ